jgi:DNA-binding transcriptional MocR family regulator
MPSIALERLSGPLHRRLCLALSQQILYSEFQKGDRLPSTRALAKALGISRNTVVSAYDKLADALDVNRRDTPAYTTEVYLPVSQYQ